MPDEIVIERPVNWMRCVVLLDRDQEIVATGVVFPDGNTVLHWGYGAIVIYPSDTAASDALEGAGYFVKSADVEVPLC